MVTIPDAKIAEVRDRIDIERLISRSVPLKKAGRQLMGRCPFHEDKSPSFSVDPVNKLFHCFGCGVGGDVFDFVMQRDAVPFPEAVKLLAAEAGVQLPERERTPEEKRSDTERKKLLRVNELAAAHFAGELARDAKARDYLEKERGLSRETIERFRIGFAPQAWQSLSDALANKGVPVELPVRLGLVGKKQKGEGHYDRFRARVMFPIRDAKGRTIGFGARRAEWAAQDDRPGPKYLNSPESPVYDKSGVFYGLDVSGETIRRTRSAILVEGYLDVIALHQAGISSAIACCGTSLSQRHAQLLKRIADDVVTMYDGDDAGRTATDRAAELLLRTGVGVRVVRLPPEHDPDTFVKAHGAEALTNQIDAAPSAIDRAITDAQTELAGRGVDGLVRVVDKIRPLLIAIPDPLRRDVSIEGAARRLDVDAAMLRHHLRHPRTRPSGRAVAPAPSRGPQNGDKPLRDLPIPRLEAEILRAVIDSPAESVPAVEEKQAVGALSHPAIEIAVSKAVQAYNSGEPFDGSRALDAVRSAQIVGKRPWGSFVKPYWPPSQ